jgi:hypothetical protein
MISSLLSANVNVIAAKTNTANTNLFITGPLREAPLQLLPTNWLLKGILVPSEQKRASYVGGAYLGGNGTGSRKAVFQFREPMNQPNSTDESASLPIANTQPRELCA